MTFMIRRFKQRYWCQQFHQYQQNLLLT